MSEAMAFFGGMIAMMIVWFVTDTIPRTHCKGCKRIFYDHYEKMQR